MAELKLQDSRSLTGIEEYIQARIEELHQQMEKGSTLEHFVGFAARIAELRWLASAIQSKREKYDANR